ncbi:hypothetical protein SISSUDRAFT_1066193 [Sistotremastrum suecicum HHB10207 ss-3]|uniref:CENP-V/GFA domain-containing protein n=1 Tax=Sistotremastrum suecicum HHB10207 ss-3 TaxID=1314776 RepID=A0A165YLF5_9AGAM|nr:hypothetical protein SISSUDRAFT_1066193 [Sistotremastrum suecicum HHB10207 ss-3]
MSSESSLKLYKGHCHCGKFAYEFKHAPLESHKATVCNCSICSRKAYVYSSLTPLTDVTWTSGELGGLTDYVWRTKTTHHYFCPIDGSALCTTLDGKPGFIFFNLNCVDDIDASALEKNFYDGKSA